MEVDTLKTFAAVARLGSITRAAEQLFTVQSNITAKVKHLEEELGVQLFHRHSRGVMLTEAGAQLLPFAERMDHLLAEAHQAATGSGEPSGQIRIGSMETTAALRLPPILTAYATQCPQVDIILQTGTSQELVEGVLRRRFDGAFVAAAIDHDDLVTDAIINEELVVVSAQSIRTLDELPLLNTKIVVFRAGCSYRQRLESLLVKRGAHIPRRLELGTLDGIIGCVAAGLGITLLPRSVVEQPRFSGALQLHALDPDLQPWITTVFVRRRDAFVSTALSMFIACAKTKGSAGLPAAWSGLTNA